MGLGTLSLLDLLQGLPSAIAMSVSSRSRAINLSVFEGMFSMASSDCKHRISPKDRVIAGKKGTIRELQIQGIQLTQHF